MCWTQKHYCSGREGQILLQHRTFGNSRMSQDGRGFRPYLDKSFPWNNFSNLAVLKSPQDRLCSREMGWTQHYCSGRGSQILKTVSYFCGQILVFSLRSNTRKVNIYNPIFLAWMLEFCTLFCLLCYYKAHHHSTGSSFVYCGLFWVKYWNSVSTVLWTPRSTFGGLLIAANGPSCYFWLYPDKRKHLIWRNTSTTRNSTKSQAAFGDTLREPEIAPNLKQHSEKHYEHQK